MKKVLLFFTICTAVFFTACSNDDDVPDTGGVPDKDVINISSDGTFPAGVLESLQQKFPEHYTFGESNSHLWVEENGTKAAGQTIKVYGYDKVKEINNYKVAYPDGLEHDYRVPHSRSQVYIATVKQYIKYVTIPKNTSLVLPPQDVFNTMKNMGRHPSKGTPQAPNTIGYSSKYNSTSSAGDKYEIITEVINVVYNIEGKELFRPPVYIPGNVTDPSNFEFKYQYISSSWD